MQRDSYGSGEDIFFYCHVSKLVREVQRKRFRSRISTRYTFCVVPPDYFSLCLCPIFRLLVVFRTPAPPSSRAGFDKMARAEKPMAMLEAALGAARDRPRVSASIAAAAVSVGVIVVLFSFKKVR